MPQENKDWIESKFKKFCKVRNWNPISMGVEYDHYLKFIESLLDKQRNEVIKLIEGKKHWVPTEQGRDMYVRIATEQNDILNEVLTEIKSL